MWFIDLECRRYMIQPPLFEISADLQKTPIVSSSLSSTLKASVTLDQRGTYCTTQVHLYARYEYDMTDLKGLWPTLDVARSLPGFESISDITINVLSKPGEASSELVGSINVSPGSDIDSEADEDDDDASDDAFDPLAVLPTPDVDGWLKSINLNIDDSVKLEINDYMFLSVHMMVMLRPYAVMRLEKEDEKMECAEFRMFGLQTDVLLAFSAAVSLFVTYTSSRKPTIFLFSICDCAKPIPFMPRSKLRSTCSTPRMTRVM